MNWIINNYQWFFSGLGTFMISIFISIIIRKKSSKSIKKKIVQSQKTGDNSINFQAGRDVKIK